MKRFLMGVAAVLIVLGIHAEEPKIPARFSFKSTGTPLWVAASEAINREGRVRDGVLNPSQWLELDSRREQQVQWREKHGRPLREGCDVAFSGYVAEWQDEYSVDTLQQLREAASTRTVITGVVTAAESGLLGGMPHTVLRIEAPGRDEKPVYLLYPAGRLLIDEKVVCNNDPAYATTPSVGDAITFVGSKAIDESESLYFVPAEWIVYEHQGTVVSAPALQTDPDLTRFSSARHVADFLRKR